MNFDTTFALSDLLTILSGVAVAAGIVWRFTVRVVKIEDEQKGQRKRFAEMEKADESMRREMVAIRSAVSAQFETLRAEFRSANEHMQNRLDSIFVRLGGRDPK